MEPERLGEIVRIASGLMRRAHEPNSPLRPTDVYNEGWLASLTIAILEEMRMESAPPPFWIAPNAQWWSEAILRSPFNPRHRGDRRADGRTNADVVIGHFRQRAGTQRGIQLLDGATQFHVVEAKIKARLTPGTLNARTFDQAARSVACMAFELEAAGVDPRNMKSLGFYVVSPSEYTETHQCLVSRESIEAKVTCRIEEYDEPWRSQLNRWCDGTFRHVLDHIEFGCITWESVIENIVESSRQRGHQQGDALAAFYRQCRDLA